MRFSRVQKYFSDVSPYYQRTYYNHANYLGNFSQKTGTMAPQTRFSIVGKLSPKFLHHDTRLNMRLLVKTLALVLILAGIATAQPARRATTFVAMFSTPNCPPCESMYPLVAWLKTRGFPITIIYDPALAERVGVTGFPTFLGVVDNRVVSGIVGPCSIQDLKNLLPGYR